MDKEKMIEYIKANRDVAREKEQANYTDEAIASYSDEELKKFYAALRGIVRRKKAKGTTVEASPDAWDNIKAFGKGDSVSVDTDTLQTYKTMIQTASNNIDKAIEKNKKSDITKAKKEAEEAIEKLNSISGASYSLAE